MGTFSWWHLAVLVLVAALLVLVLVGAARSWRRRGIDGVIGVTLVGSAFYAAVAFVIAVGTVVDVLVSRVVTIAVPVRTYWPTLPAGAAITSGPTATRVGGGFTTADLDVQGLDGLTRTLWASGLAAGILVQVAIAALIAVLCFQLLRGAAFARIVPRMTMITAGIVLAGGAAAAALHGMAGSMASTQLLAVTAAEWTNGSPDTDLLSLLPQPTLHIEFPFWPVGAALGFAALAAVLRYGARLQRDTEGLV